MPPSFHQRPGSQLGARRALSFGVFRCFSLASSPAVSSTGRKNPPRECAHEQTPSLRRSLTQRCRRRSFWCFAFACAEAATAAPAAPASSRSCPVCPCPPPDAALLVTVTVPTSARRRRRSHHRETTFLIPGSLSQAPRAIAFRTPSGPASPGSSSPRLPAPSSTSILPRLCSTASQAS